MRSEARRNETTYRRKWRNKSPVWRMTAQEFDAIPFLTQVMNEDIDRGKAVRTPYRAVFYGNCCMAFDGRHWRVPVIVVQASTQDPARLEAGRLTAMGYRRTSNKHNMLARIDREDWVQHLARHLRRAPADFYIPGEDRPAGSWCDWYRRCLSKDQITVSRSVAQLVLASGHDPVGYILGEV